MSMGRTRIVGAVIAGGQSRRMGDRDKLWIELEGQPLIARAAERLARQTDDVILNVNQPDDRLADLSRPVVRDICEGHQGPLAGIGAALSWAQENRPEATHLIAVSVDSPFFPDNLVARLADGAEGRLDEIAIAFSEDYPQPVFGLWPVTALAPLTTFLAETDNLKVMAFVRGQRWRRVDFPDYHPPAFFNINTPDDLAAARAFVEQETA